MITGGPSDLGRDRRATWLPRWSPDRSREVGEDQEAMEERHAPSRDQPLVRSDQLASAGDPWRAPGDDAPAEHQWSDCQAVRHP